MLACRNCRFPLTAEQGCAICSGVKKHLVQLGDQDEERPALSDVGSEIVAELRYALRRAKETTHNDEATAKDRLYATALVLKIGNTAAKVLESARKLQTDGLAAVRTMSFIERAKLFIDWYKALPPPYRANLRAAQEKFEADSNRALPETTNAPEDETQDGPRPTD